MNIRKLLGICEHHWIIIKNNNLTEAGNNRVVGLFIIMQCSKCGKVKHKRLLAN